MIEVVFPTKPVPIKFSPAPRTYVQGPNFHSLTNSFDKVPCKGPSYIGVGDRPGGRVLGEKLVMVWYGYKEGCFDEIDYASKTTGVATSTKLSDFPADAEGNH
jgi:hypothetical protein